MHGLDEKGNVKKFRISPQESPAKNPAFDVTPAKLVTGWVLETGIYNQEIVQQGVFK